MKGLPSPLSNEVHVLHSNNVNYFTNAFAKLHGHELFYIRLPIQFDTVMNFFANGYGCAHYSIKIKLRTVTVLPTTV